MGYMYEHVSHPVRCNASRVESSRECVEIVLEQRANSSTDTYPLHTHTHKHIYIYRLECHFRRTTTPHRGRVVAGFVPIHCPLPFRSPSSSSLFSSSASRRVAETPAIN